MLDGGTNPEWELLMDAGYVLVLAECCGTFCHLVSRTG